MSPGIHLVHKPAGPTSFSVVRDWMAAAAAEHPGRPPRLCHGGTLDPFAHGLLLILVGPATRLFDHLHAVPKVYEATVRWGVETDNGDPLGKVTYSGDASGLMPQRLDQALEGFRGWHDQTPHLTSAKRVGGERAYEKAHRGETVVLPPSRVYLHDARWLGHDLPHQSRLQLTVRGGYYVRALVRDLGGLLACGAHLSTLRRIAIGPWADPGPGSSVALRGRDLLPWLPTRILTDQDVGELRGGRPIPAATLLPPEWPLPEGFPATDTSARGFHQGRFRFLLRPEGDRLAAINALGSGL